MEKPPLFYITAALFAQGFGWLLPLHDAARLAPPSTWTLTFCSSGLTARELYGQRQRLDRRCLLPARMRRPGRARHIMITDIVQLTGFALAPLRSGAVPAAASAGRHLAWHGRGHRVHVRRACSRPACFGLAVPACSRRCFRHGARAATS